MYTFEVKLVRRLDEKLDEVASRGSLQAIASLPLFSIFKIPADGIRVAEPEFDGTGWIHRGAITYRTDQSDRDDSFAYEINRIRERLDESIRRMRPGDARWVVEDRVQHDETATGASKSVVNRAIEVAPASEANASVFAAVDEPSGRRVTTVDSPSTRDVSWNELAETIAASEAETSEFPQTNALSSDSAIEPPTREMSDHEESAAAPNPIAIEPPRERAEEAATRFQSDLGENSPNRSEEPDQADPIRSNRTDDVARYRTDQPIKNEELPAELEDDKSADSESSADSAESTPVSVERRPRSSTDSIDKTLSRAVRDFKIAADPIRLKTMMLLSDGERNVTRLCADLGNFSQPAVSHHLALMRNAGLIEARRDGKNVIYSLTDQGRVLVDVVKTYYKPD